MQAFVVLNWGVKVLAAMMELNGVWKGSFRIKFCNLFLMMTKGDLGQTIGEKEKLF